LEVFRLKHLHQHSDLSQRPVDIFLSHDWPSQIWEHGDKDTLLRIKPYFREDMMSGKLGNPPAMDLLMLLKPRFWFSAHLHVKFAAVVQHQPSNAASSSPISASTRFLALDKVIPGRGFMQFLSIPVNGVSELDFNNHRLRFDLDWVAILNKSHQKLHANESRRLNDSFINWLTPEVGSFFIVSSYLYFFRRENRLGKGCPYGLEMILRFLLYPPNRSYVVFLKEETCRLMIFYLVLGYHIYGLSLVLLLVLKLSVM
jgi:hypothetical protein